MYYHDINGFITAKVDDERIYLSREHSIETKVTTYYQYYKEGYLKYMIKSAPSENYKLKTKYEFKQDFKGRISKYYSTTFKYDEKKKIIESLFDRDSLSMLYRYNENNRLIMFDGMYGGGVCEYVVTYDKKGRVKKIYGIEDERKNASTWHDEELLNRLKKNPEEEYENIISHYKAWHDIEFIYDSNDKLIKKNISMNLGSESTWAVSYTPGIPIHSYLYNRVVLSDIYGGLEDIVPSLLNFTEINKIRKKVDSRQELLVNEFLYSNWLLSDSDYYMHHPARAFDDDPGTGWIVRSEGPGTEDFIGLKQMIL